MCHILTVYLTRTFATHSDSFDSSGAFNAFCDLASEKYVIGMPRDCRNCGLARLPRSLHSTSSSALRLPLSLEPSLVLHRRELMQASGHHRLWFIFAMPAGVSWPRYLKMLTASMLAMFVGAEVVHRYYRPDLTIPEIPPQPGELRTELLGLKKRNN
uniref:Uncharacterized protein n=1 Tax=Sphaerodactylus townsendi TaxID=933632 RepID=A0ACB8FN72_9SAUR